MTASVAILRASGRGLAVFGALALSSLLLADLSAQPLELRAVVAAGLVLAAVAVGVIWPVRLLYALVGWLFVLGLARRLLTLAVPSSAHDPLLLVEPAAVGLLLLVAVERGAFARRSALATSVAAMSVVIVLSALNPAQGGLTVGLAGLFFLFLPTLGFWIGRTLLSDAAFAGLLAVAAALAVPIAVYGLVQTFAGFPHWDSRWISQVAQGYQALNVGVAVRPFSTLTSSAEYAYVLAVGLVVWVAFGLRGLRLSLTIAAVGLLGTALILESSRIIVFLAAAALFAMLAARLRVRAAVAAIVVLVSFVATSAVVGALVPAPAATESGTTNALISHQVQGLANPLGSKSTFGIHLTLVTQGLRSAIVHPAGLGAGTVSQAAAKFGGVGRQSEADPSNLALAAGVVGVAMYVVLGVIALTRAYALARMRRDALSLAALGVVTAVLLQWFNGGQYGIALLVWVTLGWIDRASADDGKVES